MGRVVLVLALAAAGCYRPAFEAPCTVRCDDGLCPASLVCGPDRLCRAAGGGECPQDASAVDAPADAPPPPALVQQTTGAAPAVTTTWSVAYLTPPLPGDVLVMVGAIDSGPLNSVTGGGVATWVRASASTLCTNAEIWYGVTDGSSSTVKITTDSTNGDGGAWVWISEWSGLETSNLLDQHLAAGSNGPNTTPAPGAITTTAPRELVLLGVSSFTTSFDTPAPDIWTQLTKTGAGNYLQDEWYVVTASAGPFAPTVGPSTICWDAAIASFRAP